MLCTIQYCRTYSGSTQSRAKSSPADASKLGRMGGVGQGMGVSEKNRGQVRGMLEVGGDGSLHRQFALDAISSGMDPIQLGLCTAGTILEVQDPLQ